MAQVKVLIALSFIKRPPLKTLDPYADPLSLR